MPMFYYADDVFDIPASTGKILFRDELTSVHIWFISWQTYVLKDTLTVTNTCHKMIFRSRQFTGCPEHT